jgi:hypothetical protein
VVKGFDNDDRWFKGHNQGFANRIRNSNVRRVIIRVPHFPSKLRCCEVSV